VSPFRADLTTALDAALDQIAHREAHVGFERIDPRGMQAIAQRRHVGRYLDLDACDGLTGERAAVDGLRRRNTQCVRTLRVRSTHVEMRQPAIVAHQERAAVLQAAVYLYDGDARAVRPVRDPVARLQNEAARLAHRCIVPLLLTSSAL
jgi:hypothetical protein